MAANKKFSRRTITAFWTLLFATVVGVLIYNEQISILYVLVTLLLVALLLTVAFADLENVQIDGQDVPDRI